LAGAHSRLIVKGSAASAAIAKILPPTLRPRWRGRTDIPRRPPASRGSTIGAPLRSQRESSPNHERDGPKAASLVTMFSPRLARRRLAPVQLLRTHDAGPREGWTRKARVPPFQ